MANQRRLFTLSLTWILFFSPWPISGKMHFSHLGNKCSDDCQLYGTEYQCKALKTDGTEALQYCSPKKDVDYHGNECIDCCEKRGYDYYRCQTESAWGYCGDVVEDSIHYSSRYDVACYDGCEKRGYQYNWCHTKKGWDYCSTRKNVASKSQVCHSDHPCDKRGKDYFWCDLEGGGWDYCGRVEPKAMIHQTYKLKECIDECQFYSSYFWCHTKNGWDYCSPLPDVTYGGVDCRPDHKCEAHGYSYNWCYTTASNSYSYCGVIHPGECRYSEPHRRQVICTKEDNNQRRVSTFTAEDAQQQILEPDKKLRNEALHLINQWNNQGLADQARSNLITSDNLHVDLQGSINRNNQQCYNLQIQCNVPHCNKESTTLAQIIVPVDTSVEYMRVAFRQSLQHRASIFLEVSETVMPGRTVCNLPN